MSDKPPTIDSEQVGWTEALGEHGSFPTQPRTTGELLIALGREWTVSSDEARIKAAFEQWVRRNAKQAIRLAEEEDGPEEADSMRSVYAADIGSGHYTWDGRHIRNALKDVPGLRHFLFLCLVRCHPEMTEGMVASMFAESPKDCSLAIRWALGNLRSPARKTESSTGASDARPTTERQEAPPIPQGTQFGTAAFVGSEPPRYSPQDLQRGFQKLNQQPR